MESKRAPASFMSDRISRRKMMLGTASGAALLSGAVSCSTASKTQGVEAPAANIPSFKTGSRLVFMGDSITDMKWGRDETDRNHYLGHSFVFLLAARLGVEMPEAKLDFYNRGISGNRIGNLRKRWERDAIATKPDLLSVLVGVNDVHSHLDDLDVDQWEADYRYVLEASRRADPKLRIVLMDPFVLASGRLEPPSEYRRWRTQADRLGVVVGRLANDFEAVHVPLQAVFDQAEKDVSPEHWIWDGIHPLPQGHELIARHWLQAVAKRWPES